MALIELGALDDANVDDLASRLGVGERQLRRLFRHHLGASPIAVAQTRRVLLAKQLIHESALPMTEIAFAAGFGSVRRFNETFQALFGRSPGELRRAHGPEISSASQGKIELLLRYQPPYDWPSILEFLRRRAIPGIERVTDQDYARTLRLNGSTGTVTIKPAHDRDALRVVVRFPILSALPAIIARVRRVFDLAADRCRSPHISRRIQRWHLWSWLAPACACPAPGTALSSPYAPCLDSRSRLSRPQPSQEGSLHPMVTASLSRTAP